MAKLFWFIVMVFVLIGGYMIYNSLETDLEEKEGRQEFLKKGVKWLLQIGKSTTETVGFAVKQDWLPKTNESNMSVIVVG